MNSTTKKQAIHHQTVNEISEIIRRWKEHAYDEEISVAYQYLMDIDELLRGKVE
tara:strand:+ start:1166 stop:1327 length:162 start_codon:yes stop_codon:yes gene_type:complete